VNTLNRQQGPVVVPEALAYVRGRGLDYHIAVDLSRFRRSGDDVHIIGRQVRQRLVLETTVASVPSVHEVGMQILREAVSHQRQELLLAETGGVRHNNTEAVAIAEPIEALTEVSTAQSP
jgi:hypothetical protein